MRITESQLRRYIRKALKENHQSFKLNNGVPQTETIPPEDIPVIQAIADNVYARDIVLEVTPNDWVVTLFKRGNPIVILQHNLVNDVWKGTGPSEREADAFGERILKDKTQVMKFAKNFGGDGPVDRGMRSLSDFFSF